MKQFFKVLICNLVIFFVLFVCVEFTVSWNEINKRFTITNGNEVTFSQRLENYLRVVGEYYLKADISGLDFEYEFRKPAIGKNFDGENIILTGCSFTSGEAIEYEDTFGVILSEDFDKYSVYNVGISGGSAKQGLYILQNYDYYSNKNMLPADKSKTKYVIYTYIGDHPARLLGDLYRLAPCFKIKRDKNGEEYLEFYKSKNILRKTFIYRFVFRMINDNDFYRIYKNQLFMLYIKQMKNEVKQNCPNAKFVLFMWDEDGNVDIKTLNEWGIKVVRLKDISPENFREPKYKASDGNHPNGLAWRTIVPLLMKELEK